MGDKKIKTALQLREDFETAKGIPDLFERALELEKLHSCGHEIIGQGFEPFLFFTYAGMLCGAAISGLGRHEAVGASMMIGTLIVSGLCMASFRNRHRQSRSIAFDVMREAKIAYKDTKSAIRYADGNTLQKMAASPCYHKAMEQEDLRECFLTAVAKETSLTLGQPPAGRAFQPH